MEHTSSKHEFENLCHNIIWLRDFHRLSKKDMAKLLEISLYTLNRLERGEIPPRLSVESLFFVSDHFHIPPYRLLTSRLDEDEPMP